MGSEQYHLVGGKFDEYLNEFFIICKPFENETLVLTCLEYLHAVSAYKKQLVEFLEIKKHRPVTMIRNTIQRKAIK